MTEPEHEKAFEDYLSRRAGISARLTESDGLEPPAELDRIVLANAREAIRIRSSPPPFRFARWAVPFGAVATVVLSFAVVLHLGLLSPKATREVEKAEAQLGSPQSAQQASSEVAADSITPAAPPAANTTAAPAAGLAEPAGVAKRAAKQEDPQVWLKRIEELRAQGKVAEADRELEAFRKAWPDYPVNAGSNR